MYKRQVPGLTKALVQPFPCALERLRGGKLLVDGVDLLLYRLLLKLDPLLFLSLIHISQAASGPERHA